jgi:hypothetical protein
VHVARAQEKGAQKLQRHIVQLHVVANHVGQLLNDGRLSPALWRPAEESCIKQTNLLFSK